MNGTLTRIIVSCQSESPFGFGSLQITSKLVCFLFSRITLNFPIHILLYKNEPFSHTSTPHEFNFLPFNLPNVLEQPLKILPL